MVIRIWQTCIIFSCIAIPCEFAKPFSLNEAIAAEERQKGLQATSTSRPKLISETSERISLHKILKPNRVKSKKLKTSGNVFPRGKKISSLQYRKAFQIRSPLKPNKLKYIPKARHRFRNQSIKREISDDENFHRKYIPLLRSLSMLFDNILATESGDSHETRRSNVRRHARRHFSKRNKTGCTCNESDMEVEEFKSEKETIVSTTPIEQISTTFEPTTTEAPPTTAHHTTASDISSFRQDTELPVLLAGDTDGTRGDHTRLGEGSGPPLYSGTEGNITGDNRNSEHNTGSGENKPRSKNNEENPYSAPRNYASSDGDRGGIRGDGPGTRHPVYRGGFDATDLSPKSTDGFGYTGRDFVQSQKENKLQTGGNEKEGSELVSKFVRGDRGIVSEDNVSNNSEPVQPEKDHEESFDDVRLYIASDQRFPVGDGSPAAKDQESSSKNATLITISDLNNPMIMLQNSHQHKAPYVTIIDGYSVARDINGANKLAEQSIRFHS